MTEEHAKMEVEADSEIDDEVKEEEVESSVVADDSLAKQDDDESQSCASTSPKRKRVSFAREVCDFPEYKIRGILNAILPDVKIDDEALVALGKAIQLAVQEYGKAACDQAPGNSVKYDHFAAAVRANSGRMFTVIRDMVPERKTFADVKRLIAESEAAAEDDD